MLCQSDEQLTGGGWIADRSNAGGIIMSQSHPTADNKGWYVEGEADAGELGLKAVAQCAKL